MLVRLGPLSAPPLMGLFPKDRDLNRTLEELDLSNASTQQIVLMRSSGTISQGYSSTTTTNYHYIDHAHAVS